MRNKIIAGVLAVMSLTACEDWLDVNTTPYNPTSVNPPLLLPAAQTYTATWLQTDRGVSHLGSMIMYHYSEAAGFSWYNDEFLYRADASTFYANIFNSAYLNGLKSYATIKNSDVEVYGAYHAISDIMMAYTYQILADFYGDIPYSEALQRSNNPTPSYDTAEEVYDALIIQLTDAIDMIDAAEASNSSFMPGSDDQMFGGDMDMWKKFANTIKIRILNREHNAKDASYINAELATIAAEGSGYITEDVSIAAGYLNEEGKQNPMWASFGAGPDGTTTLSGNATSASDYIIDVLETSADPRIDFIFERPDDGHLGVPQGIVADPAVYAPALVSNIGPGILKGADQASIILTLAEHNLNMAELALSGFSVGGSAEEYYNKGVTASFETLGVTTMFDDDEDATTPDIELSASQSANRYLAQGFQNVNYVASTDKLQAIIYQKWLAVIGFTGEQAWFDWVRTGYPLNLPVSQEAANLVRPVRLSYPASELSTNAANVPTQPNVFNDKIFWAQ